MAQDIGVNIVGFQSAYCGILVDWQDSGSKGIEAISFLPSRCKPFL